MHGGESPTRRRNPYLTGETPTEPRRRYQPQTPCRSPKHYAGLHQSQSRKPHHPIAASMFPSSSHTAAESGYPCPHCEKVYSRRKHLARHKVTHSGQKSFRCPFCGGSFMKSEVARRHARTCTRRGDSALPPGAKPGRKAQACDRCARSKSSCDKSRPCSRCRAQNAPCSYQRVKGDDEAMQMQFLLRFTDTSLEHPGPTISADAMDETRTEDVSTEPAYPFLTDDEVLFNWCLGDLLFDRVLDFPQRDISPEQTYLPYVLPPSNSYSILDGRVEEILLALSSTHNQMLNQRLIDPADFDMRLARSVFTAENITEFCRIYFIRCYPHAPMVHRPTFSPETASTPLLLAMFATASVFLGLQDSAISARRFLRTIEEYIFDQSILRHRAQRNQHFPDLEVLQAAWITVAIQGSMNNMQTSRRVRVERFPKLIVTMRANGFLGTKHGAQGADWKLWIETETRIRLATYAFWADSHSSMFLNSPPQMAVSEITADLPCSEELFEATALEFEELSRRTQHKPPPSISQLVPMLLQGWVPDDLHKSLTMHHMFLLIAALQPTVFTARTIGFGKETLGAVWRATVRWESLWNTIIERTKAEPPKRHLVGFMKHAAEVCWLIRTVVRVSESEDLSCAYMQNIATDSVKDLHDFIRNYKGVYSY